jgi:site-specific recombinase XerD
MWNEIAAWQEILKEHPDLSAKTIALYTQDARRFATWLQQEHPGLKATEITSTDAKALLDPAAYGLDRPPMPLPAIQQLLGHADIATTTIYTRVSADDLARMMGTV